MKKIILYSLFLCLFARSNQAVIINNLYKKQNLKNGSITAQILNSTANVFEIILIPWILHTSFKSLYKISHWIFQKNKQLQGYKTNEEVLLPVNAFTKAFYKEYPGYAQNLIESTQDFFNKVNSSNVSRKIIAKALARHYNLYKIPVFIDELIDEPEFEKHLITVNERLKYNKKFYDTLANIPGYKKNELCELIEKLLEIIKYRKKQNACRQENHELDEDSSLD